MRTVAKVVPPKEDEKMATFTSVTVTARYDRAADTTTVKVTAWGDEAHGGIKLVEVEPVPGCYQDGQVLCVGVKFEPPTGRESRWVDTQSFNRSAEYVVLLYQRGSEFWVLTARPVEKV